MRNLTLYFNLLLIFFPAFSLSYPLTGIYFQSRILGLPFLVWHLLKNKKGLPKDLIILCIPCFISISIPVLGLFADRTFGLIDIGYILSFLYLIFFAQSMSKNIELFIDYLKYFTIANIIYALLQIFLMNIGMDSLAMIHSNLPSQVEAGYTIPASTILPYIYRFSGLFNESSPLIFYLCSFFVFSLEIKITKPSKSISWIQLITLIMIAISDSKFAYVFLILLPFFKIAGLTKIKYFKELVNFLLLVLAIVYLFYNYSTIVDALASNLPAFSDRHTNVENSILSLSELGIFGKGFVSSTSGEVGLDAVSIVVGGYGGLFGVGLLISFLFWILASKVKYKENFLVVYILGLSSSGSFLISQYTLFFTMIYIVNKRHEKKYSAHPISYNNYDTKLMTTN